MNYHCTAKSEVPMEANSLFLDSIFIGSSQGNVERAFVNPQGGPGFFALIKTPETFP
jgi:hypothetical protein